MTNIFAFDRAFRRRPRRSAEVVANGAGERLRAAVPREEGLRTVLGVVGGSTLTAWRSRSGQRYVASVAPLALDEIEHLSNAVVIAVAHTANGAAAVEVAGFGPGAPSADGEAWIARMRARGADALHIHRLPEGVEALRSALADLAGLPAARHPASARSSGGRSSERLAAMPARMGSLTPISTNWACVDRT